MFLGNTPHPRYFRIAFEQVVGQLILVLQHLYLRYQYAQVFVLQVASSLLSFIQFMGVFIIIFSPMLVSYCYLACTFD